MESKKCKIPNHHNKPIIFICSNLNCSFEERFGCLKCQKEYHSDHWDQCLEVDEFIAQIEQKRNLNKLQEIGVKQLCNEFDELSDNLSQKLEMLKKQINAEIENWKSYVSNKKKILNEFSSQQFAEIVMNLNEEALYSLKTQELNILTWLYKGQDWKCYKDISLKVLHQKQKSILNKLSDSIKSYKTNRNQRNEQKISQVSGPGPMDKFKIVFIGDQTGKTSIINRFIFDTFNENEQVKKNISFSSYQPTVGVDFLSKSFQIENKTIRLQLWDTGGKKEFRSLIPTYIKDSAAAVICYDITNEKSFSNLQKWIEDVEKVRGNEVLIYILGNKIDLKDQRQVTQEIAEARIRELGVCYQEVSAKTGSNIQEFFKQLSYELTQQKYRINIHN